MVELKPRRTILNCVQLSKPKQPYITVTVTTIIIMIIIVVVVVAVAIVALDITVVAAHIVIV